MGFVVRFRLRENLVGSYPAFSPLSAFVETTADGIFSVTLLRHLGLATWVPPLSRGMLPYGVRTFLWPDSHRTSDRPHSTKITTVQLLCKGLAW